MGLSARVKPIKAIKNRNIRRSAQYKAYSFPLDIAGLMTSASAEEFVKASEELLEHAYAMGVSRDYEAFMSLSFMGLAVIPELKLTDKGLFDVNKFAFIDINAD